MTIKTIVPRLAISPCQTVLINVAYYGVFRMALFLGELDGWVLELTAGRKALAQGCRYLANDGCPALARGIFTAMATVQL